MIEIIVIGIVATLVTDIWQRLLQAVAGVPAARWGLIGRRGPALPAAPSFINRWRRRRATVANSHSVWHSLCDRHRVGRHLCCDREVWLGHRPDAHFRAGRFTRVTPRLATISALSSISPVVTGPSSLVIRRRLILKPATRDKP